MVWIGLEHRLDDGGGTQIRGGVPHTLIQAQERERVEHLGFSVRREARDQPLHSQRVGGVAGGLRALAVENLDGVEICLLPGGERLGAPGGGRRAEAQ